MGYAENLDALFGPLDPETLAAFLATAPDDADELLATALEEVGTSVPTLEPSPGGSSPPPVDLEGLALAVRAVHFYLGEREPWRRDALCREYPELNFFPSRGEPLDDVKAVCARCLVRCECEQAASTGGSSLGGIWGGLSARGRRQARTVAA